MTDMTKTVKVLTGDTHAQAAVDRGDFTITKDEYLTYWLYGDVTNAFELQRSAGEWEWHTTEVEVLVHRNVRIPVPAHLSDEAALKHAYEVATAVFPDAALIDAIDIHR